MNKRILINIAFILFTLFYIFAPVSALSFELLGEPVSEVSPGDAFKWQFILNGGDSGTEFIIEIYGYREDFEGNIIAVPPDQDTNRYSARTFFQPEKITSYVGPGEKKIEEFVIRIPSNEKDGIRYALVRITNPPKGSTQIGIATAMQLPVKFTLKGGRFIREGKINSIRIDPVTTNQPIIVYTTFENTGNSRYNVTNTIEISDNAGNLVGAYSVKKASPVPGTTYDMKIAFTPEGELSLGTYQAHSRVSLDDGTILDETTGNFEITKPFVPPPAATSAMIEPSRESTLKTSDGRIQITFPAGAVSSSVKLSFQSIPQEAVPEVPNGAALGATVFQFDGIAGILAEEATLKVKYIDGDLEVAGGDPAKLALARWDEGKRAWQFYATELDEAQGTLTTKTDRLSAWAVMAVTDKSLLPQASLTWAVSVLALAIVVIGLDRKRRK